MKTAAPPVLLREGRTPDDLEELTNVWRDAVEATHRFLPLKTIERLESQVRDECLPSLRLQVAERSGGILAFIGLEKNQVAMLFVADEARSMGIGSNLLAWAQNQSVRLSLDVNEQNPRATFLYQARLHSGGPLGHRCPELRFSAAAHEVENRARRPRLVFVPVVPPDVGPGVGLARGRMWRSC